MKSGYDQFFKKARENAQQGSAGPSALKPRFKMKTRPQAPRREKTAQEITDELRARLKAKKKARKARIPWRLAGVSFLGLIVAFAGLYGHDTVESWAKRIEISMIGTASAEEAKPAAKDAKDAKKEGAEAKKEEAHEEAPKKEFTEEEINHFAKLNDRKRELDAREEELNHLEAELQTQKAELEKRMQDLDKTRRDISSVLEERVKTDDKKVDTLVQMYSNMKPQQAAKIFEEMDEDLAVDIIGRMKKKNAAEIMNLIKPDKAKIFAEKFAGYKRSS